MKFLRSRRDFLADMGMAAAATMTLPLLSCDEPERYNDDDAARLIEQKQKERERSGTGRFGPRHYRGYRGLAKLPYFETDGSGRLKCVVEDLPPIIDFHSHLGISALLSPKIDLLSRTDRVQHFLDCDAKTPGCDLDLDVYINANFDEDDLATLEWETVGQLVWGSEFAATHTIPNLLAEMDACGVQQAVVLPIALGLPFGDRLADDWTDAIRLSNTGDRLLPGASIHPGDANAVAELRRQSAMGARVVKLHPAMQRFYPDSPELGPIYEECGQLGLPVFFHAGRAGIEPEYTQRFTLIRHYEGAVGEHPDVNFIFGHAGARDVADAIPFAKRHPNVTLDIHGQGISQIDELIEELGANRLVFGSDWPFYHLAATLAKVLIVTEGRPEVRAAILTDNAQKLLAMTGVPEPQVRPLASANSPPPHRFDPPG